MTALSPSRVRPTALFIAFIVIVLLLPLVPWAVISAEDAPPTAGQPAVAAEPTATDVPAQPLAVATEPPPAATEPPPPTDLPLPTPTPTPTPTATEPPVMVETDSVDPTKVEPSIVATEGPVEPGATEAPAGETPEPTVTDTLAPEGSPEANAAEEDLMEISGVSLLALPSTGGGLLTLNGQTGLVYLNTSTSLNFHVPDIANLAALFPVSGGYAMSTTISEYYEQWGCDRGGYRYHRHHGPYPNYTWDMTLPPRSPGLYSFQASVYVSDLNGNRLALGRTQCIDVSVSSGSPFLLVNGSAGPLVSDDATQLTFAAGNLPAEAAKHQLIRSTSPDCSNRSLMANFGPGVVVSHTSYDSVPGVRWYQVRSHNANGFPLAETPCVQVELRTAVATLHINSEQVEVSAIEGQSANLFATGLPPGQVANLIYYPAAGCVGSSFIDPSSPYTVSDSGQVDRSFTLYSAGRESVSVLFRTAARETNCVSIHFLPNESQLLVNGSRGPISVVLGDELHLVASGLPPGVAAFPAFGCDLNDVPDDLPGTVGQDGTIEFFLSDGFPEDAFSVHVRLEPPSTAATNCVFVQFFDVEVDPALTINGSTSQATVLVNESYAIVGTGLPPLTRVTLARHDESSDCTGDATSLETETTEQGTLETTGSRDQPGTWSYRVLTPRGDSNCVAVRAMGEPVLTINGSSGPLSVMVGTTLNLEVSGWPSAGSGLLREITLGEFCESPAWSVFPVGAAGFDGTATHAVSTLDSMVGTRSYRISGEAEIGGSTVQLVTNCVTVTVEGWSPLVTVNGSAGPLEVTTTMPLTVEVSNLPDTAYQARLYPGRTGSDCSGVPMSSNLHSRESGQDTISVGYSPLPNPLDVPFAYSFNAQIHYRSDTGEERLLWSNCVLVVVDDAAMIVDPPTEPATEEPTEPVTEEPTEPVTEEPTQPATEQPTDVPTMPITEEPTEPATEQPTDVPTDVPTDPATEEPTDGPTDVPTDVATESPTDPATEPATEEPTGEPTVPVTISPTGGSGGSTPPAGGAGGGGATTGGLEPGQLAGNGDSTVSRLPVTGATGGADHSLLGLLVLAAMLFAGAGSVVSRGGRRS